MKYRNIIVGILSGLLLFFLLMTESMSDDTGLKSIEKLPMEQSEKALTDTHHENDSNGKANQEVTKDVDSQSLLPDLSLMLVGVVLVDGEESSALIVYKKTSEHGVYKVGETVGGAKVVEINRDNVVVEKDGKRQILVLKGDISKEKIPSTTKMDPQPPSKVNSIETLPHFEPLDSKTGPPVDKSIPVKDLPHFKPVTNKTGPPVDKNIPLKELPPFEPVKSKTGPPELNK